MGKILHFAGYTSDFENNTSHLPLSIEHGRRNTYVAKQYTNKQNAISVRAGFIIYECLIIAVILWPTVYALYMAIRDDDYVLFGRSWFQVLVCAQYYYGITYFGMNHYYENIVCNTKLKTYIDVVLPLATIIGTCLAIINVVLLNLNYKMLVYADIYKSSEIVGKVLISALLFIESIYTYITFLINACIFSINMLYHRQRVTTYATDLGNYIKSSLSTVRKLNNVGVEYTQMKTKFDETVTLLTPFFTVLNFIGFITIYFYMRAITNNLLGVSEIINFILFVLVETIYIVAIQAVNTNVSNINVILSSNTIIAEYFGNKVFNRTMPAHELYMRDSHMMTYKDKYNNGIDLPRPDSEEENNDGMTTSDIALTDYNKPKCNPNDEHKEYHRTDAEHNNNQDYEFMNDIMSGQIKTLSNNVAENDMMLRNILVASISNQQMLDWISLRNIVSGRWLTFRIFGVEFTDTSIIAKLFGIAVVILMSSEFGSLMRWW